MIDQRHLKSCLSWLKKLNINSFYFDIEVAKSERSVLDLFEVQLRHEIKNSNDPVRKSNLFLALSVVNHKFQKPYMHFTRQYFKCSLEAHLMDRKIDDSMVQISCGSFPVECGVCDSLNKKFMSGMVSTINNPLGELVCKRAAVCAGRYFVMSNRLYQRKINTI